MWLTDAPPLTGVVEVDEAYIGGLEKNKHGDKRIPNSYGGVGKTVVIGAKSRGGEVRAATIPDTTASSLRNFIVQNVAAGSTVYTDEHRGYAQIPYAHDVVSHSEHEYVRGDVTVNGIEGFWSRMKRSIHGTYIRRRPSIFTGTWGSLLLGKTRQMPGPGPGWKGLSRVCPVHD